MSPSSRILTFHGVGPVPRPIDRGERNCWLDRERFESVLDCLKGRTDVEITFDDGNASDLTIAAPALERRGLRATFFICTGRLGQPTFLSAEGVQQLRSRGMQIGSHGINHVPWRTLDEGQLEEELGRSRAVLQEITGEAISEAACPFGAYNRRVLNVAGAKGYDSVYTSDGGLARPDDWVRPRTTITQHTSFADLDRLLSRQPSFAAQFVIDVKRTIKRLR